MIDSAIQTVLGHAWVQGKIQYNYLGPDKVAAETVAYYENGQMRFCYPILHNRLHGVGRVWYANGTLHCEESFSHHALDGPQKEWHPNGRIKKEAHYKKGLLEGECQEWYETGVLRLRSFYAQDRLEGEYWEWYGNGQMRKQFSYAGGRRHGILRYGRPDGTIQKREFYLRDVRIPADIYKRIQSHQLTAKDILAMENTAIRRICLEEMGYARFLAQLDHHILEKNGDYELVRIDWHEKEEPIYLVKVRCPSTEAFYALRVPPHTVTVRQAIAWTFDLKATEYCPQKET